MTPALQTRARPAPESRPDRAPGSRGRSSGESAIGLIRILLLFEASLYSAVTPVLPHYARTLHLGKPGVGVLAAAYSAGVLPGSLIGGWLASRAGVRRTTMIGLLAFAGFAAAFGWATDVTTLDVLRAAQGLACGCIWAGALTWAIAVAPRERRGAVVGSVFGAAVFGTLLGPVLGMLAVTLGTGAIFTAVGVISLGLAWRVHHEPPPAGAGPTVALRIRTLRRSHGLALGSWLVLLEAMIIGATSALLPLRLAAQGAGGVAIGATFLIASAISAWLAPRVGRLVDRRGPLWPLSLGLGFSAVLMAALPGPTAWPATALVALLLLGGPLSGLMTPAVSLMTGGAERAGLGLVLVTTIINLAYAVGETVGAPTAAGLSSATSDAVPLLALAAIILATLVWARRHRARVAT